MRWSLVVLAIVIVPAIALAKPKLAVAPLDGDKDGAVADVIAEEAAEHGKTTKPERVSREMEKLDLSAVSTKSAKKLRARLEVDVVIHGKLDKDGGKKHLELVLSGPGNASSFDVDFRTTKDLKKALATKLGRAIDNAVSGKGGSASDDADGDKRKDRDDDRSSRDDDDKRKDRDDDSRSSRGDDEDKRSPFSGKGDEDGDKRKDRDDTRKDRDDDKRSSRDDDDKRSTFRKGDEDNDKRKDRDDDRRKDRDDDKRSSRDDKRKDRDDDKRSSRDDKRKGSRDDDDRHKRSASRDDDDDDTAIHEGDDDEDGGGRRHKKKRHREGARHPLTQAAAWADAGVGFARRSLTYVGGGMTPPPPVGTAAPAAQIEGEVYPGSFSTLKGPAAGIGIAGAFDRELALGIAVPGTMGVVAPIKSGYYWIGARYRFVFGGNSIAVGASYWRRTYMADRSGLGMTPEKLDMPDVDYTAVAPDVTGRFAASPKLGVFASVQLPLMLNSGPIQDNKSYGPSKIIAFDVRSGVQYAFGAHYALQVALAFDQVGFKFGAKQGTMAAARDVSAATDRSIGLAATLGIMY